MFLIDTDILIYSFKGDRQVIRNMEANRSYPKAISVITYGELVFGACKSERKTENMARVVRLRELFPIIDVTPGIMEVYGNLKAERQQMGRSIDDFDLIIAATALSLSYILVTNNEKHFGDFSELSIANWSKAVC